MYVVHSAGDAAFAIDDAAVMSNLSACAGTLNVF